MNGDVELAGEESFPLVDDEPRKNTWRNDQYIRDLLDRREKWVTVLSLSAAAAAFVFLADHPHETWLKFAPLVIGAFGSLYVFVVNCYYGQAEEISKKKTEAEKETVKERWCTSFAGSIGFLGCLNTLAPVLIGVLATVALFHGFLPATAPVPHTHNVSPAIPP